MANLGKRTSCSDPGKALESQGSQVRVDAGGMLAASKVDCRDPYRACMPLKFASKDLLAEACVSPSMRCGDPSPQLKPSWCAVSCFGLQGGFLLRERERLQSHATGAPTHSTNNMIQKKDQNHCQLR